MSDNVYNQVIERMAVEPTFAERVQSGDAAALEGLDLSESERSSLLALGADQGGSAQELRARISKSAIIGGGGGAHHVAAASTLLSTDHSAPHVDVTPVDVSHAVTVDLTPPLDPGTHMDPTGHLVPNDPAHFHMAPDGQTTLPNDPAPGTPPPPPPAPGGPPGAANPVLLVPAVQQPNVVLPVTPDLGGAGAPHVELHHGGLGTGAPAGGPAIDHAVVLDTGPPAGGVGTGDGLTHIQAAHDLPSHSMTTLGPGIQFNPENQPFDPHSGAHVAGSNGTGYVAPPAVDETGQTQTGLYHHPDGSVEHDYANGDHVITTTDGTTIVEHNNGETVTIHPDGTWTDMHPDGTATEYFKNGDVVTVALDGSSTHAHSDGTTDFYNTANKLTKTEFPDGTWVDSSYQVHTQWGTFPEQGSTDYHGTNAANGSPETWPYGTMKLDGQGYNTSVSGYPAYPGHPVAIPYQNGFIVFDSADHATLYQVPGGESTFDPGQTASLISQLHQDQLAYCKAQASAESYSQGGGGGGGW